MKIANPLNRPAKPAPPDPALVYQVVGGFCADTPSLPNWSPRIGTRIRGDSTLLQHVFGLGGGKYFARADLDDIEKQRAASEILLSAQDGPPSDDGLGIRTPGPIPEERRMVVVRQILTPAGAIAVGTIVDANHELVRTFPKSFAKAPPAAPVAEQVPVFSSRPRASVGELLDSGVVDEAAFAFVEPLPPVED